MSNIPGTKRLSDNDVKEIFASLLQPGKRPPEHLQYTIVPVGPNGLKLSPPSHEFDDGLYVLLRPQPKKKSLPIPQAPDHLRDLVMDTPLPENCAWSLSGPQFPINNKEGSLQQRYCYPKGRPEYSSFKGGALWTIRGADGKEENEYRLLHVYQSQKRAANKGIILGSSKTNSTSDFSYYQPVSKKARHVTPSRDRILPTRYTAHQTSYHNGIHRIHSSTSLSTMPTMDDTTLSFPTLDDGYSHSFESIQAGTPTTHHYSYNNHSTTHDPMHDTDFPFHDLQNDPLLQEMDKRSLSYNQATLMKRLGVVHDSIRKYVMDQPTHQQADLVSTVAGWARALAMDPLHEHVRNKSTGEEDHCHEW